MEKCRNEANRSGVCRCQIRAYDKNAEGPARPLLADETSGTLLFSTKRPSSAGESGSCRSSHWSHKVGDLFRAFLESRRSAVPFSGVVNGPRQGWAAGSDRFCPLSAHLPETLEYKGLATNRFFAFGHVNWHRYLKCQNDLRRVIRARCAESRVLPMS